MIVFFNNINKFILFVFMCPPLLPSLNPSLCVHFVARVKKRCIILFHFNFPPTINLSEQHRYRVANLQAASSIPSCIMEIWRGCQLQVWVKKNKHSFLLVPPFKCVGDSNGNASETRSNESFDNGVFFDIEAKRTASTVSKLFSKRS